MTKRGQLLSTIFVAIFIAIMIPVAIFATTSGGMTVSNRVQYFVEDLDGTFSYAITGNRLDQGTHSSFDVGYDPVSDVINPQTVFTAGWDEGYGTYLVKNGTGGIVYDQMINLPNSKGLEFDMRNIQNNIPINYYFVFVNKAVQDGDEPRDVYLTTKAEHQIPNTQVDTYWSYIVKFTDNPNFTQLDISGTWSTSKDNSLAFETGIRVAPKDVVNDTYNYIILRYTLDYIGQENAEFKSDINLTITLKNTVNQ